jgi:hypothetical protein
LVNSGPGSAPAQSSNACVSLLNSDFFSKSGGMDLAAHNRRRREFGGLHQQPAGRSQGWFLPGLPQLSRLDETRTNPNSLTSPPSGPGLRSCGRRSPSRSSPRSSRLCV